MAIWDEMRRMQEEMDRMFDNFFRKRPDNELLESGESPGSLEEYRSPLTDVWETDNEVVAKLEVPGVKKDDIKVNATDDGVEVKVEKSDDYEQKDKKKGMYKYERSYCGFYRKIPMQNANPQKAKAKYDNGVLEIRAPKTEEKKGKVIDIE